MRPSRDVENAVRRQGEVRPPSTKKLDPAYEMTGGGTVEPRTARTLRVLHHYFMQQGLATDVAAELAELSRLQLHPRTAEQVLLGRRYIEFVVCGTILVNGRIWGGNYVLGNLDIFTEVPSIGQRERVQFLAETRTIRIPRDALRSRAVRDLSVVRMIHQRLMSYVNEFEWLYGTSTLAPICRVARLLHHLSFQQELGAEILIGVLDPNIVLGPSQRDFSEALGLGLATVEKSIRALRDHDILGSSTGTRTNRTYKINERARLRQIATGTALDD
ncbi:hypothetical protein ACIQM4_33505 [Streptomyces sp. NPDC091272]|uniref:hypothetical protein n=1 Tax=Streptomyces sp. NPDC091272 TaxID=3365981 RepID=UPI0038154B4B